MPLLMTLVALTLADPTPVLSQTIPDQMTIGRGTVQAKLVIENGILATRAFRSLVTSENAKEAPIELPLHPGDEFELVMEGGTPLTSRDFRVTAWNVVQEGEIELATAELNPVRLPGPKITVEWQSRKGAPWLRKRLVVQSPMRIESIAVSAWEPEAKTMAGGGFGQPMWIDDHWFVGIEHPAGDTEIGPSGVVCRHYPGREQVTTPWTVVGTGSVPGMRIEDAFLRYLSSLRPAPEPSLQYNSWFDRRGSEITPKQSMATFELFRQYLLTPYNLRFDAFTIDDGWQDPNSLWGYSPEWEQGLAPLARHLQKYRSRLGLWLPLTGYSLHTEFGRSQGWKVAEGTRKDYYCLSDANYASRLRTVLEKRIEEGKLAYIKHDFNFLRCQCGVPEDSLAGRQDLEAGVDAELALLAYERTLAPGIFLNITSSIWPSPWWLAHADTIWMGGSDHALDRTSFHSGDRQAEMNYRDGRLYELLAVENIPVPPSRLMTHGIIRGRYDHTEPMETRSDWADYVMMYFGRGTVLYELYISPDRMPADFWPVLGEAIRWAEANAATLRHTRMIGGDPRKSEPYGYIHWGSDRGIAVLRNPSPLPRSLVITTQERPKDLPARSTWEPVVVYPQRQRLETMSEWMRVDLPADSVVTVELYSELPATLRDIPVGHFAMQRSDAGMTLSGLAPLSMRWSRTGRAVAEKKIDERSFARSPSKGPLETSIDVILSPAGGLAMGLDDSAGKRVSTWRRFGQATDENWEWRRYALGPSAPGEQQSFAWKTTLPPSPFYPQRAEMDVVLRQQGPRRTTWQQVFSADTPPLYWPAEKYPDILYHEEILAAGRSFSRSRSQAEEWAWGALFATLSLALVAGSGWLAGRQSPRIRWVVMTATTVLIMAALAWTPLGTALGRILHGT